MKGKRKDRLSLFRSLANESAEISAERKKLRDLGYTHDEAVVAVGERRANARRTKEAG